MREDETAPTCADVERNILCAIQDCVRDGEPEMARDLAQTLLLLRQAQATGAAAGTATPGETVMTNATTQLAGIVPFLSR